MRRMERAFTLIELLIVVAIIAILAAIAVPNFLEAQVRAKVARVESDMRTYATAIESYIVDNNHPPVGFNSPAAGNIGVRQWVYHLLTTPVAYVTALPRDPFCQVGADREESKYYFYNSFSEGSGGGVYAGADVMAKIRSRGYIWAMYSLGPRRTETWPWIEDMLSGAQSRQVSLGNIYDPTNGTVSGGKIYRTNKGELSDIN